MMKHIVRIFLCLVAFVVSMRVASFALLLADQSSDLAVLGAIGIIFLLVLVDTFVVKTLFGIKI